MYVGKIKISRSKAKVLIKTKYYNNVQIINIILK